MDDLDTAPHRATLPVPLDAAHREPSSDSGSGDAAKAFIELREEVALLRHAVSGLSAEKARLEMPDYSPTLTAMNERLGAIIKVLKAMREKPWLDWTPEGIAERIGKASEPSRRSDAEVIRQARSGHEQATQSIQSLIGTIRTRDQQRRHLLRVAAGGLLAGCLLWSFLPGTLARALPDSWHLPERMARHMVGQPTLWQAGVHIMLADSPSAWARIVDAMTLRGQNRDAIDVCERSAERTRRAVKCMIIVGGD